MSPHLADRLMVLAAFVLPVCAVILIRRRILAVLVGTLSGWAVLAFSGEVLGTLDPSYEPGSVTDSVWILLGWVPSLLYTVLVSLAKTLITRRRAVRDGK